MFAAQAIRKHDCRLVGIRVDVGQKAGGGIHCGFFGFPQVRRGEGDLHIGRGDFVFGIKADDDAPSGDAQLFAVFVDVFLAVDVEEEPPLVLEGFDDFVKSEAFGRSVAEKNTPVLVGGGIGPGGFAHLFEVEGGEDFLDAFFQFRLGPDCDYFVFVDEDVEKRVLTHGTKADHAVLKEQVAAFADHLEKAVGTEQVVRDVRVDLAIGILAQDIEDGVDAARDEREEHAAKRLNAVGGDHDVKDVAIRPFFPFGVAVRIVATVGGFKEDGVTGAGRHFLDRVDAQRELEAADFDALDAWIGFTAGQSDSVRNRGEGGYGHESEQSKAVSVTYAGTMANEGTGEDRMGIEGVLVALCVGNTRTRIGVIADWKVQEGRSVLHEEVSEACSKLLESSNASGFVIASVNKPVSVKLEMELESKAPVYVIGRDVEIAMTHALDDDSTVGQDRLLDAVGAFARLKEACIVADIGTAITIDFVDGQGTFQGGVIAPGVRAMMRAMHATTSALPELEFEVPDASRGPFGKDTAHAMRLGVRNAVCGLLRETVERMAERFGTFPTVIATGGDAGLIEEDPLVDRVVPDLQMMGVAEACRVAMGGVVELGGAADGEDDSSGDE